MASEKSVAGDPVIKDVELARTVTEEVGEATIVVDTAGYKRKLTKRQIMMITFGAGIGTGLWVGTGTALKNGERV